MSGPAPLSTAALILAWISGQLMKSQVTSVLFWEPQSCDLLDEEVLRLGDEIGAGEDGELAAALDVAGGAGAAALCRGAVEPSTSGCRRWRGRGRRRCG